MKKILLIIILLLPNSVLAQGLSPYGDWGGPPETRRDGYIPPLIFPQIEILPPEFQIPYFIPPQFYVDPRPDDFETVPLLRVKPEAKGRPDIEPEEPEVILFPNDEEFGTILISTKRRFLVFTLNDQQAYMYQIGVGRDGFTWSGEEQVSRIEYWPDWIPPKEMLERRPELPERMAGGINNPLGAVAIYLGKSLYRIHGTNDPKSIGKAESSGCFRMLNKHALHLASIVSIGTRVKVYK